MAQSSNSKVWLMVHSVRCETVLIMHRLAREGRGKVGQLSKTELFEPLSWRQKTVRADEPARPRMKNIGKKITMQKAHMCERAKSAAHLLDS